MRQSTPPPPGKSLGPVSDLERHLPEDWSQSLLDSLYQRPGPRAGDSAAEAAADIEAVIRAAGLAPGQRILDLCCGQGRHALDLARRGFRAVTGLDRSRYLVRLARKRARQQGVAVTFHHADPRRFRLPEAGFDCIVMLGNAFAQFDREADDVAVLEAAKRALVSDGRLVLDLVDGAWLRDHFEPRSWEWIDQTRFACRERSLAADGARLISREVVVHAEKGVIADQFYAERLFSSAGISELLQSLGFTGVAIEARQGTAAAPRLLVTARAPRRLREAGPERRPFPEVTVVLGDPTMADSGKVDGRFGAEDFEAFARMKAALGELKDYRFRYLEDHRSLIAELQRRPPAFALNFCDTGYRNEATRELHVPALLELLGIPYSGAGPTCLGLCYDKAIVRAIASALDIPVPLETYYDSSDQAATIPSVFPALIKPSSGDGSVGITRDSVVHDAEQAIAYLRRLHADLPGRAALIQEYLTGAEYGVGLIGNPGLGFTALPPLEVDYSGLDPGLPPILSYESKADPDSPYWSQIRYREARLDEATRRRLVDYASLLFERLGCRDYARFDFRADAEGEIKLLEVNPNPAWCWDGKMNIMAGFAGLGYPELLRLILDAAESRVAASRAPAEAAAAG